MSTPRFVFFTPYGRGAGSSRVRVFEWIEHLGLRAEVNTFTEGNAAGLKQLARQPIRTFQRHRQLAATRIGTGDIVVIHREISPLSDGRAEARLLQAGARGVVDLDDGLHWDWGSGGRARRFRPKAPKVIRMVKAADLVIAGNDLIAEWAARHAERVVVIPSCVEPGRYRRKVDYELHHPPVVGWIGSAATERHLEAMNDEFLSSHDERGTRLAIVGADAGSSGALERMVDRTPWSETVAYGAAAAWDAAVMPLPDGLFERSKCGYKLLQYGASGVPSVGSPIGVNAEICRMGTHDSKSPVHLSALLRLSAEERESLGHELAARVERHFSFSAHARRYAAAICDAGSNAALPVRASGVDRDLSSPSLPPSDAALTGESRSAGGEH